MKTLLSYMLGEETHHRYDPLKYTVYGSASQSDQKKDHEDESFKPTQLSTSMKDNSKETQLQTLKRPPQKAPPETSEAVRMGSWIVPGAVIETGNGARRQLADDSLHGRGTPTQVMVQAAPSRASEYNENLYKTPWEIHQEVVSTGAMLLPHTGEVIETFENAMPAPNRAAGDQERENKQKQLRLEWAQGGETRRHTKQDLEVPLPAADSGPINEMKSYEQRQSVMLEALHRGERALSTNKNDELLQLPQMTRNPYGHRGFQPMVRINPYLASTNQLDNNGWTGQKENSITLQAMKPNTRLHRELNTYERRGPAQAWDEREALDANVRISNTQRQIHQNPLRQPSNEYGDSITGEVILKQETESSPISFLQGNESSMPQIASIESVKQTLDMHESRNLQDNRGASVAVASMESVVESLKLPQENHQIENLQDYGGSSFAIASMESVVESLQHQSAKNITPHTSNIFTNASEIKLVDEKVSKLTQTAHGMEHGAPPQEVSRSTNETIYEGFTNLANQHGTSVNSAELTMRESNELYGAFPVVAPKNRQMAAISLHSNKKTTLPTTRSTCDVHIGPLPKIAETQVVYGIVDGELRALPTIHEDHAICIAAADAVPETYQEARQHVTENAMYGPSGEHQQKMINQSSSHPHLSAQGDIAQSSFNSEHRSPAHDSISTLTANTESYISARTQATSEITRKRDIDNQATGNAIHDNGRMLRGEVMVNDNRGTIEIDRQGYQRVGGDIVPYKKTEAPHIACAVTHETPEPRRVRDLLLSHQAPRGTWTRNGRERSSRARTQKTFTHKCGISGLHDELESNSESEYV